MIGVAAALSGYLLRPMNPLIRLLSLVGGLLMMYPGTSTDVIGFVIFALAIFWQVISAKRGSGAPA